MNTFCGTNERDRDDEAAQFIDGVQSFLEVRVARDVCVIRVRQDRAANFFAPTVLAQPCYAHKRVAFG